MTNAAPYFAAAAFAFALIVILLLGAAADWWVLLNGAPVGAGVAAMVIWPYTQGAWAGAAIGFIAHPIMWYIAMVILWATGARSSLGDPTINPINALVAHWVFAAWSWFLTGWLTIPAAALLGWWITRPR